ncbi:transposase [Streptomyces adustus]
MRADAEREARIVVANAEWLTVFRLPTYAPDLNPTEGVWSLVDRGIGNLAAANLGEVTRAVKRKRSRRLHGKAAPERK